MGAEEEVDVAIVGGGLQAGLVALALLDQPRPPRLAIIERDHRLGGNHTWCFHEDDLPPAMARAVAPLVVARWDGHDVVFPTLRRTIAAAYSAVSSARLDEVVRARVAAAPDAQLLLGRAATAVGAREVALEGGGAVRARLVIDARGPTEGAVSDAGFQKFVGVELALERPHAIERPIVMDATVAQLDGYRFAYVLPLAPDRVLVEDTMFSDTPVLDRALVRERALAYARSRGLGPAQVVREEAGVLPMPWGGEALPRVERDGPLSAGVRGGWFHPATGYSFPLAARLAALVASLPPERVIGPELERLAAQVRRQARFCRQLNRLLFRWCAPASRWQVLARFYRLPEETIRRFYALELGAADQARLLIGRPPPGLSLRTRLARRKAGPTTPGWSSRPTPTDGRPGVA
ncbi:MAG TPA: lycopene beta-cyclase CrtY [Kofleriaceae bacterium]|nr:lycopene beta-cyclase CrtY [Kofleriaceae bacterium]